MSIFDEIISSHHLTVQLITDVEQFVAKSLTKTS